MKPQGLKRYSGLQKIGHITHTRSKTLWKRNNNGKSQKEKHDNDIGIFAMLKYGRNEEYDVLRFHWSRTTLGLFWGIFIFIMRVPPSNLLS